MESARIVFWHSSTCCGFCCLLRTSHGITGSNILSVLVHRSVLVWCFWNTSQSRWWFTKKRFYCGGWFSKRSVVVAFFLEILHKVLRVNYWKWHNYSDILRNLQYVAVNLAFMVCTIFETVDLINYIGTFIWVQESQCVNHHSSSRLCGGGSVSSPCRQSREHHWEPGMSIGCEELPPFLWVPHFLLTWGLVGVLGCFVGFFLSHHWFKPSLFLWPLWKLWSAWPAESPLSWHPCSVFTFWAWPFWRLHFAFVRCWTVCSESLWCASLHELQDFWHQSTDWHKN